jgi:hypothetical protein
VLDIPMPKVMLDRPGVVALVGELEAANMAEHVGMDREAEFCLFASPGDDLRTEESVIAPRRSIVKT